MGDTNVNLPGLVPGAIDEAAKNVSGPLTTGVGKTFGDLWFLAMGGISQAADKKRIKYAAELEKYKKSVEEKIMAIPEERRVEPDTQVVCQALEASKYCVENEDIREMFANLIASTMDSDTADLAHPSFPEILKQMSAFDAKIFRLFAEEIDLPVCEYIVFTENNFYKRLQANVLLKEIADDGKDIIESIERKAISINTLVRSGLLIADYNSHLSDESLYNNFYKTKLFDLYKQAYPGKKIDLKRGAVRITPLGRSLSEICCPINSVFNVTPSLNQSL